MKKAKLFAIQISKGGVWDSECLYKGDLRKAMSYADSVYGSAGSRVIRVKTPAEYDKYLMLEVLGDGQATTEWVN
jgi:hypothetical protein